jgi:hypothetical protein
VDQLHRAIADSGETEYAIAKGNKGLLQGCLRAKASLAEQAMSELKRNEVENWYR